MLAFFVHHVFECAFADGGIAVPHLIFLWLELCWHFSWSLKQSLQVGIQVFKEASRVFTGQCFELGTSNILRLDLSGLPKFDQPSIYMDVLQDL